MKVIVEHCEAGHAAVIEVITDTDPPHIYRVEVANVFIDGVDESVVSVEVNGREIFSRREPPPKPRPGYVRLAARGGTIGMMVDPVISRIPLEDTLPVDGSRFDPEEYPELAEVLEGLGLPRGQLPNLYGRIRGVLPSAPNPYPNDRPHGE